ncbi:MAG: 1-acyl-sn-glycerol-3-phosphate acyltransferase [Simkaniaceae bacterium]|nr:1-acyl-sn-glycerol-3-phosphate acyltransferase [Simkaniaceae bacterium]
MKKVSFLYILILSFAKSLLHLFYKIQIVGRENLPEGGALLAANHVSYLDPPLVAIASPGEVHFLARDTLFHGVFGRLISALNAHPVSDDHNLNAVKLLVRLLNQGNKVVIFPEGARSLDGTVQEIKPGIGLIMNSSKKPIVPVYIEGAFSIWPRGKKWPRPGGKLTIYFGEPLLWENFKEAPKAKVAEAIKEAWKVLELRDHKGY